MNSPESDKRSQDIEDSMDSNDSAYRNHACYREKCRNNLTYVMANLELMFFLVIVIVAIVFAPRTIFKDIEIFNTKRLVSMAEKAIGKKIKNMDFDDPFPIS